MTDKRAKLVECSRDGKINRFNSMCLSVTFTILVQKPVFNTSVTTPSLISLTNSLSLSTCSVTFKVGSRKKRFTYSLVIIGGASFPNCPHIKLLSHALINWNKLFKLSEVI